MERPSGSSAMAINTRTPNVSTALAPVEPIGQEPAIDESVDELARLRAELELTRRELAHSREENARQLGIERIHAEMLANVLDAIITIDTHQRIRYLNRSAEQQYRVRASEVIGAPLSCLYRCCWPDPADEALVNDTLQSTGRWCGGLEQELPDGTRLQVNALFSVLRDATGTVIGTLACLRDVGDRASMHSVLRDSEEQFRNWLLNIPTPIYIKDRDGRYLLANHWAQQTLRNPLGVIGRNDFELMPRETAERLRGHDREVLESNCASQREQLIYDRHYLSLKFPLRSGDGSPAAVCGVSIDITELKQAQLELVEARAQLHKQNSAVLRLRELATRNLPGEDPDALLEPILQTAVELHDAACGLISLLDHDTAGLRTAASTNLDQLAVRQLTGCLPVSGGNAHGSEFSALRRVVLQDIETDSCNQRFRDLARRIGLRAVHSTPILTRAGFALGVLSLYFKQPHSPSELEIQVAELCARQAADSIEATAQRQALRESEERFRTMADHAPVMVWVADAQHACTYVSKSWYEFTGQSATQALGFGWSEAMHPDDRHDVYREFIRAAQEHRSVRLECRFRRHDGSYRWCIDTATPRFTTDGSFAGLVGSVIDITERKAQEEALRQSEKLYRAIGEALDYGIWICDADGRNRYVSESFLRLVGITQDECSLYGWVRHLHPEEAQTTLIAWRNCVRTGGVWSQTCRFKGLDGKYHSMLVRGLPVRDEPGEIVCWAGIILDANREHQAQAAIQEAERRNDEFLAKVSQALRNPLASLRAELESLRRQAPLAQAQSCDCASINQDVDLLESMVDDLLDLSRSNRGLLELRIETVPLQEVIALAVNAVHPHLDAAQHELTLELPAEPVLLQADRMRLAQMLMKLLDNSIKYTPNRGHIKLSAQLQDAELQLCIEDDGIGICAAVLPTIFSNSTQLETRMQRGGGLGIGLALVKALAEQHGGQITAHSDGEGKGSTFTLKLPLTAPQQPAIPRGALQRSLRARRVLIADEDAEAAQQLAMLLDLLGHATWVVNDGMAAIDAVPSFAPDFVFLDLSLSQIDGIDTARRIRQLRLAQQPRIVAVSSRAHPGDLELSQSAGMDFHAIKPISMQTLRALIDNHNESGALH